MPSLDLRVLKKVRFHLNFLAEEALNKLNHTKLLKKSIRIAWYSRELGQQDRYKYNVFIKRIDKSVTSKEFNEFFEKFGKIISSKLVEDEDGENTGFGFVSYETQTAADLAIKEAHEKILNGKPLYVVKHEKNRPKKKPQFNNIYAKNIPKSWSETEILNYFKTYGQIGSHIIRIPNSSNLDKLPEEKRTFILNHQYAFICYKEFDPAKNVVDKVSYLKLTDQEYNKKLESLVDILKKTGLDKEHWYRAACFIIENFTDVKKDDNSIKEYLEKFNLV